MAHLSERNWRRRLRHWKHRYRREVAIGAATLAFGLATLWLLSNVGGLGGEASYQRPAGSEFAGLESTPEEQDYYARAKPAERVMIQQDRTDRLLYQSGAGSTPEQ